ncbi:MAG: hypothetical protein NVSMB25_17130 [Thermoleophilaceae bacterium]
MLMLGLCAAGAVAVSACASNSSSTSSGASQAQTPASPGAGTTGSTVSLSADPSGQLKFSTRHADAKPGKVVLRFSNPSPIAHGVSIEGKGLDRDGRVIQHGATSTLMVDLKPGTYTFYCPVSGHRQAGMQGTLLVR